MLTSVAKDQAQPAADGTAVSATAGTTEGDGSPRRGRLIVACLVLLLLGLEFFLFELSQSKGSPSWQAGYDLGLRLGRAAGHRPAGAPRQDECLPTRRRVDTGDFREGCIAGYRVAISHGSTARGPVR